MTLRPQIEAIAKKALDEPGAYSDTVINALIAHARDSRRAHLAAAAADERLISTLQASRLPAVPPAETERDSKD